MSRAFPYDQRPLRVREIIKSENAPARVYGKKFEGGNFRVKEEPFAFHARATVRVRAERGLDRWCRGLGAANFAPFRNSARMKMIWDQRNSTPVIQHFSPKLLGLSYQRERARCARVSARVRACARAALGAPPDSAHGGFLVKSELLAAFYPGAGTEYV